MIHSVPLESKKTILRKISYYFIYDGFFRIIDMESTQDSLTILNLILGFGSGILGVILGLLWSSLEKRPCISKTVILPPEEIGIPNYPFLTLSNVGSRNITKLELSAYVELDEKKKYLFIKEGENQIKLKTIITPQNPISFRFNSPIQDLISKGKDKSIIHMELLYYDDYLINRKLEEKLTFILDKNLYKHVGNAMSYLTDEKNK